MSGSDQTDSVMINKLSVEAQQNFCQKVRRLSRQGEFADAQELMERLLSDYPNHSEALYFISVAQRFRENYRCAELVAKIY